MKTISLFMEKVLDFIEKILETIAGILLASFSIIVLLQVIVRFVINQPLFPWSEEVSRYLFIWMVYVGSVIGIRRIQHYRLVLFLHSLSKKKRMYFEVFINIFIIAFFYFVLINSFSFYHVIKTNLSPVLRISMGIPYFSVVIFGIFGLIFAIENMIKYIVSIKQIKDEVA